MTRAANFRAGQVCSGVVASQRSDRCGPQHLDPCAAMQRDGDARKSARRCFTFEAAADAAPSDERDETHIAHVSSQWFVPIGCCLKTTVTDLAKTCALVSLLSDAVESQ